MKEYELGSIGGFILYYAFSGNTDRVRALSVFPALHDFVFKCSADHHWPADVKRCGFLYIARNSIFHHRRKPDDEWRYFQANRKLRKTAGGLDAWWSCGC